MKWVGSASGRRMGLVASAVSVSILAAGAVYLTDHRANSAAPPPIEAVPISNGTYKIGTDIPTGRWHTDGPRAVRYGPVNAVNVKGPLCSFLVGWPETVNGTEHIADVQHQTVTGPTDVDLHLIGASFQTDGCKDWQRVGD